MRDAVDARGLEQAAQREISKGLTACQVAVARDNEILWTASFGSAAAETKGRVDYAAKIEAGEPGGGGVMTAGPEWGARSASRSRRRASPSLSSRWAIRISSASSCAGSRCRTSRWSWGADPPAVGPSRVVDVLL